MRKVHFPARIAAGELGVVNKLVAGEDEGALGEISAVVRRLEAGTTLTWQSGENEGVFVVLGGVVSATTKSQEGEQRFEKLGRRRDPFDGMPWALYVSRYTEVTLSVLEATAEVALGYAPTDRDHPVRCVSPDDVTIEIRGGHGNTRQVNGIVPPGFPCHRLVAVEVYTPGGNWSSYPPHKHDTHVEGPEGLVEADLEEIYLYKMRQPGGHAVQRVYTASRSLDALALAEDGDIVTVPEGYHPVSAAYGYDCYYLNFLAGTAQSLAATDDPEHAWVKDTWTATDPRVPMVTHAMEAGRR